MKIRNVVIWAAMSIPELRKYYKPVQPTVRAWDSGVQYTEFLPSKNLQPFIYAYWELKSNQVLKQPFSYRVVADGCIDIYFECSRSDQS
jgi:hypothetical protein